MVKSTLDAKLEGAKTTMEILDLLVRTGETMLRENTMTREVRTATTVELGYWKRFQGTMVREITKLEKLREEQAP